MSRVGFWYGRESGVRLAVKDDLAVDSKDDRPSKDEVDVGDGCTDFLSGTG